MSLLKLRGDRTAEGSIGSLKRDEQGELIGEPLDAISLQLHEPVPALGSWVLDIHVNTGFGFAKMGSVLTGSPDELTGRDRVVAVAACPGARAWTVVVRGFVGTPPAASAVLRAAVSRYGGAVGVRALNRAILIGNAPSTYSHDTAAGPGTTSVPAANTVTHIAAEAGTGGCTVTIGAFAPITVGPGQVFTLPAGATATLVGPVDIVFAGDVVNRFVATQAGV